MSSQGPVAEIVIAALCNDNEGGRLDKYSEFDISLAPVETPEAWLEEALEEAREKTAGKPDRVVKEAEEKAREEARSRTIRVALPGSTPGERGIARALATAVNEAMAGTGVVATAFAGETTADDDTELFTDEPVAKVVIEGVREVNLAWNHTKVICWAWGRSGHTGNPLFPLTESPGIHVPPVRAWPGFQPPVPPPRSRPSQPPPQPIPGKPGGKGGILPPQKLHKPSEAMREHLEGGGSSVDPEGDWRRLALGVRFRSSSAGWAANSEFSEEWNAWKFRVLWLPPGLRPEEEAAQVLAAWEALCQLHSAESSHGIAALMIRVNGCVESGDGRVHYQLNLNPPRIEVLVGAGPLPRESRSDGPVFRAVQEHGSAALRTPSEPMRAEEPLALRDQPDARPALLDSHVANLGSGNQAAGTVQQFREELGQPTREAALGEGAPASLPAEVGGVASPHDSWASTRTGCCAQGRAWWQPAACVRPPWEAGGAWAPLGTRGDCVVQWVRVPNAQPVQAQFGGAP